MKNRTAFAVIGTVLTLLCLPLDALADPPPADHRILNQAGAPVSRVKIFYGANATIRAFPLSGSHITRFSMCALSFPNRISTGIGKIQATPTLRGANERSRTATYSPNPLLPLDLHYSIRNVHPVSITRYTASYQPRGSYSREGIRHTLAYKNASERKIVALQFGLLAFNIFNEFQDRLGGYTIQDVEPGAAADGVWVASALAESAFYTGVAYVSKVRFVDGEIWSADLESITKQLQEIEAAFPVESLQSK